MNSQATAKHFDAIMSLPIGKLGITVEGDALSGVSFIPEDSGQEDSSRENSDQKIASHSTTENAFAQKVCHQISEYFNNPKSSFKLPMKVQGTALQAKIWKALTDIPLGATMTYGELAEKLATHPRIIGNACRANPTPVVVPCHRVVSKTGLGGFSGATVGEMINIKQWLLAHEKSAVFI